MRIIVGVEHPKRVHFWKNAINNLKRDGHEVKIVARVKDISLYLLDAYGFEYEVYGMNYRGLIKKVYGMIESDIKLLRITRKFKPDIFVGKGSAYLGQVSKLLGKPYICFSDTEHAKLANWFTHPFSDVICTPSCFKGKIDQKKHVMYNGYEELAYLHPNYFKPDPSVLDNLGLSKDDKFIVLRFVSWKASHDIGQYGFKNTKIRFVKELEKYGKVFITSETKLNKEFEKYRIRIPPEKMHDFLYYATLHVGESSTMATEAGILGTPSIHISSLAPTMGNFEELENKYDIVYSFQDPNKAIEKTLELIEDKNLKKEWKRKREKLLKDKIDVTKFMTEFIENYPESFTEYKRKMMDNDV